MGGDRHPEAGQDRDGVPRLRAALLFGLPALLALAWLVWPVISGAETLILRDVLQAHLAMKASLAEALRAGYLPLIDGARSGGQPLAGNPNAVPFYPDNLLFLVAPLFWAFNFHFWFHLLVAPLAAYWMGRTWGLPRPASWAVAVCYGTSGFMLSQLNLYNLIAGAALTPALVAATLRAGDRRPWAAPVAGLLWALLLVSGDPLTAVLAGLLAVTALFVRSGARPGLRPVILLGVGVVLGTLVAAPQIVEFLRILPTSLRGHQGFGDWRLSVGALRPVHAVEWLVPLAFGRYDLVRDGGLWGASLFEGKLPIFLSLYPGLLSLVLVACSGRPRSRAAWWGWGAVGVGVFLALGSHNPAAVWLFQLPGADAFRYPVRIWPLVAVGASLLCGIGFQRTVGRAIGGPAADLVAGLVADPVRAEDAVGGESAGPRARLRPPALALGLLGFALLAVALFLALAPGRFEALVLAAAPAGWPVHYAAVERARWVATVVASFGVLLGLAAGFALARTRPSAGAALLLALQAVAQVTLLHSLAVTDRVQYYETPPPALAAVAEGAPVVQADYLHLFGAAREMHTPDNRAQWAIRQGYLELSPFAGVLSGLRFELDRSPEGLGTFLARVAAAVVEGAPDDATRLRALSRWGIGTVISEAPLRGIPPGLGALAGTFAGPAAPIHVYRLPRRTPPVLLAEQILSVPDLTAARQLFLDPRFDPQRLVILPGPEDAPPSTLPAAGDGSAAPSPGRVRVLAEGPESLEVATDAQAAGVLVVQRAELPIWRAEVDGAPAAIEPANIYRIGVRVPAGAHRVRLWVDRRPLAVSSWVALAGFLGLLGLAVAGFRR